MAVKIAVTYLWYFILSYAASIQWRYFAVENWADNARSPNETKLPAVESNRRLYSVVLSGPVTKLNCDYQARRNAIFTACQHCRVCRDDVYVRAMKTLVQLKRNKTRRKCYGGSTVSAVGRHCRWTASSPVSAARLSGEQVIEMAASG